MSTSKKVVLTVTPEQAQVISKAMDVYTRLCLGQIETVAEMVIRGDIPVCYRGDDGNARLPDGQPKPPSLEVCNDVRSLVNLIKSRLGHPNHGSYGIGAPELPKSALRAYEIEKVLDKALAEDRDPSPSFRSVDYDGLTVRYTDDPVPRAQLT